MNRGDGVGENGSDALNYKHDKRNVEPAPSAGLVAEDHIVDSLLKWGLVYNLRVVVWLQIVA